MVDKDYKCYAPSLLRDWKQRAEGSADRELKATRSRYRALAASEVRLETSVAEAVALKELEEEFGCHIERDVHISTGTGWLWFIGAAVRGEDLIGIDIREDHGNGIPYFQVEHLLDLCAKVAFPRFHKCVVYLVVVSDGPVDIDLPVKEKLEDLLRAAGLEGQVRVFRLRALRAKWGL